MRRRTSQELGWRIAWVGVAAVIATAMTAVFLLTAQAGFEFLPIFLVYAGGTSALVCVLAVVPSLVVWRLTRSAVLRSGLAARRADIVSASVSALIVSGGLVAIVSLAAEGPVPAAPFGFAMIAMFWAAAFATWLLRPDSGAGQS